MAVFYDLKVQVEDERMTMKCLDMLIKVGYQSVAINQFIRLDKKIPSLTIPCGKEVSVSEASKAQIQASGRPFRQYNRITVVLENASQVHHLLGNSIQQFDIVAVQPATEKLFQQACTSLEVDVIALDLTEKLPFYLRTSPVQQAIAKGIHFEICYAPTIRDSGLRRRVLANAIDVVRVTKGKNIIVTSGVEKLMEIRGPYDVANLAQLFGLHQGEAKRSICENCRSVILHGEARRNTVKSVISCQLASNISDSDRWKLDGYRYSISEGSKRPLSPSKECDEACERKRKK